MTVIEKRGKYRLITGVFNWYFIEKKILFWWITVDNETLKGNFKNMDVVKKEFDRITKKR